MSGKSPDDPGFWRYFRPDDGPRLGPAILHGLLCYLLTSLASVVLGLNLN
jgi:hypothetical protein